MAAHPFPLSRHPASSSLAGPNPMRLGSRTRTGDRGDYRIEPPDEAGPDLASIRTRDAERVKERPRSLALGPIDARTARNSLATLARRLRAYGLVAEVAVWWADARMSSASRPRLISPAGETACLALRPLAITTPGQAAELRLIGSRTLFGRPLRSDAISGRAVKMHDR